MPICRTVEADEAGVCTAIEAGIAETVLVIGGLMVPLEDAEWR